MTYKIEKIDLIHIYLNNDNPRHDPIENEPKIIEHLIAKEKVKQLARHIAQAGRISPLERIAVVAHPKAENTYITVEGNRRLCAIKLLAAPDKADTEANMKYFRTLADKMENPPSKLEVVIFKDMEAARPWISLRHEGEQDGAGTKSWNPEQQARFNVQGGANNNPNIQADLLREYARKNNLLTSEKIDALSITTLTRYVSNPIFRDMLGLADNKTLTITVPTDEFNRVVTRFLSDTLDSKTGVNSRTSVLDRKVYAEKLRSGGIAPTTRGLLPVDIKSTPRPLTKTSGIKTLSTRNNRSPDDRKRVIPNEFKAHINDKTLKRLYDELRNLDADEFSFAATYLLRAVIEQIATLFLKQNGLGLERQELNIKLGKVAEIFAKEGMKDRELKALRTMASDKDSRYSPDTIGHFVHGGAIPTRTDAIRTWDSIETVIIATLSKLK